VSKLATGLDVHEATVHMTRIDDKCQILEQQEFPHTKQGIAALLRVVPKDEVLVMEAGTHAKGLLKHLRKAERVVVMAHPKEVRRHAPDHHKSDPMDSFEIAKQYVLGLVKECYVPDEEGEALRALVRHRIDLSHKTTRVKNQVHSLLGKNGVHHEYDGESLWSRAGVKFLGNLSLPDVEARVLGFHLRELELLAEETEVVDKGLADLGAKRKDVKQLMSIAGVDYYGALVVLAELGDPRRFPTEKHVASYSGLVPGKDQSGKTEKHKRIHKQGPNNLKWILVCLATSVVKQRGNEKLRRFHRKVQRRAGKGAQGRNKAKVAVAHKLVIIMWRMLLTGEMYEERDDNLTARKEKRMRGRAKTLPKVEVSAAAKRLEGKKLDPGGWEVAA